MQPRAAGGYYLEGLALEASGDAGKARAALEKAVAANPRAADPLVALVRLDLAERRPEQALARLDARLKEQPDSAIMHSLRGDVLMAMRRPADAVKSYAEASRLEPRWPPPYRGKSLAEVAAGDREAAVATLRQGVDGTGGAVLLVADLAGLLDRLGRTDEAIAVYDAALERGDRSELVANNLAMLLVSYRDNTQDLTRAAELVSRFASSPNPAFLDTYGWVLYKQGRPAEAVPVLERAAAAAPQVPLVLYHLGIAQLGAGQNAAARASLEASLKIGTSYEGAEDAKAIIARLRSADVR
jgi:tetratricopeptide (TPR) repeat protein